MESTEYLICAECETPCYDFEIKAERVVAVMCAICGNEEPDQFLTQSEYEDLLG